MPSTTCLSALPNGRRSILLLAAQECVVGVGLIFGLFMRATVRGGTVISDLGTLRRVTRPAT